MSKIQSNLALIRWLTYLMFLTFAMTTDAVGVIIPEVIDEFSLSLTEAGAFHYATMIAIAIAGVGLGFLADRWGRKPAIMLGLALYALACFLFAGGDSFGFFLGLLVASGLAVGLFKTGALALIGDISTSPKQHAATMNTVEGYFGVGAILGPLIVTALLNRGISWTWLYVLAGFVCLVLLVFAWRVNYPEQKQAKQSAAGFVETLALLKDPFALGFSLAIALYVATEVAIYVWMPTLLKAYEGGATFFAAYALTIFFVLRAGGRFLGAWLLSQMRWQLVLAVFGTAIFACFMGSMIVGVDAAVYLLPLSGLFMSVVYPTLNAKGIACFPRARSGAIAGVILFFTAAAAALGPLAMGAVGDTFGDVKYGFYLATAFAGLLSLGLLINLVLNPAKARHDQVASASYQNAMSQ